MASKESADTKPVVKPVTTNSSDSKSQTDSKKESEKNLPKEDKVSPANNAEQPVVTMENLVPTYSATGHPAILSDFMM